MYKTELWLNLRKIHGIKVLLINGGMVTSSWGGLGVTITPIKSHKLRGKLSERGFNIRRLNYGLGGNLCLLKDHL